MAWILHNKADAAIIQEIERESDRGLMIIGVSYLERRLTETIQLRMKPDISSKDFGSVFKGYGPLSSFSAKIDLGFLMQFYPEESRYVMHKLRDLRNDAAHALDPVNFQTPTIAQRSINLKSLTDISFNSFV